MKEKKNKVKTAAEIFEAYDDFVVKKRPGWGEATNKIYTSIRNHLTEFETSFGKLTFEKINSENM